MGIAKIKPTQPQLGLAGAWAELGNMIFNFSRKYQFSTNMTLEGEKIETESEIKILGTHITSDLKWNKNTSEIVKKAYQRMQILHRAAKFTSNRNDLRSIYISYIRSILEKSAVVWHSSLTEKNKKDLERIQKCAVFLIMGKIIPIIKKA